MKVAALLEAFARLPVADLDTIAPGTSLVLAPHPDDESLGMGGFIASACAEGRPPFVVVASDGAASHPGSRSWPPARLAAIRQAETREAVAILGLSPERLLFMELPDTRVPGEGEALDKAVDRLTDLIKLHDIRQMLVTWRHDPHCDHEAVWHIGAALHARDACRVLVYPVWGLTRPSDEDLAEMPPRGWRLPVASYLDTKRAAISAHASQLGRVVTDDPGGFVLPETLLAKMLQPYEIILDPFGDVT